MRKFISVFSAAVILSSAFLSGCSKETSDGAGYTFDCALTGNPSSLDPQTAEDENSLTVIGNMFMGLLKTGSSGAIEKGIAEDYEIAADGLTYTFKLRDDCFWFYDENKNDKADKGEYKRVTADDFVFAFQRIFNQETCSPYREKFRCLKNASDIIDHNGDYTSVGVKASGDKTVVFSLDYANAEFLNSLSSTPAMPCNQEFFESTKGRYGLDDSSIISNGAFFVRQWFYDQYGKDNFIYMKRNTVNDKSDKIYPSFVNFYIKESYDDAKKSFSESKSDVLVSFTAEKGLTKNCNVNGYSNYTLGLVINPESKSYSNVNIRKALAYGIDKSNFADNLSDDLSAADGVIPPDISILNKSYRELYSDKNISIPYNEKKAVAYFEKGMKDMQLQSLENIKILVPKNIMDTEYLHLVTQNWQKLFGFYIGIDEVSQEEYDQKIDDGEYDVAIYALSGNYNSPVSVLENFESNNNFLQYSNNQFDSKLDSIRKLENYNQGLDKIAEAEKIIIDDCIFIPVFYKKEYLIMGEGNSDVMFNPFTKQIYFQKAKYRD